MIPRCLMPFVLLAACYESEPKFFVKYMVQLLVYVAWTKR